MHLTIKHNTGSIHKPNGKKKLKCPNLFVGSRYQCNILYQNVVGENTVKYLMWRRYD